MKLETKKKIYQSIMPTITATVMALSGCGSKTELVTTDSKLEELEQTTVQNLTTEIEYNGPKKEYYIENNGIYTKLENVKYYDYNRYYSYVSIGFKDGSHMRLPLADFYIFDVSSENQQELVRTLTSNNKQ